MSKFVPKFVTKFVTINIEEPLGINLSVQGVITLLEKSQFKDTKGYIFKSFDGTELQYLFGYISANEELDKFIELYKDKNIENANIELMILRPELNRAVQLSNNEYNPSVYDIDKEKRDIAKQEFLEWRTEKIEEAKILDNELKAEKKDQDRLLAIKKSREIEKLMEKKIHKPPTILITPTKIIELELKIDVICCEVDGQLYYIGKGIYQPGSNNFSEFYANIFLPYYGFRGNMLIKHPETGGNTILDFILNFIKEDFNRDLKYYNEGGDSNNTEYITDNGTHYILKKNILDDPTIISLIDNISSILDEPKFDKIFISYFEAVLKTMFLHGDNHEGLHRTKIARPLDYYHGELEDLNHGRKALLGQVSKYMILLQRFPIDNDYKTLKTSINLTKSLMERYPEKLYSYKTDYPWYNYILNGKSIYDFCGYDLDDCISFETQPGASLARQMTSSTQPGASLARQMTSSTQPDAILARQMTSSTQPGASLARQASTQPGASLSRQASTQPGASLSRQASTQPGASLSRQASTQPGASLSRQASTQPLARQMTTSHSIEGIIQEGDEGDEEYPRGGYKIRKTKKRKNIKKKKNTKISKKRKNTKNRKNSKRKTKR
jgi:hypothetical protein